VIIVYVAMNDVTIFTIKGMLVKSYNEKILLGLMKVKNYPNKIGK